ncbi:MAG: hypothetical protein AAF310_03125 [Myxococcota bacterium]
MYSIKLTRLSCICLAVCLWTACDGDGSVKVQASVTSSRANATNGQGSTANRSQDAAVLATSITTASKTDKVDLAAAVLQGNGMSSNVSSVSLTGCGDSKINLQQGQLWLYPATQPKGIVLITHDLVVQPETALSNIIEWAKSDHLSVLLLRLAGHRQDKSKAAVTASVAAWKNDEEVALCMAHQLRQAAGHPHVFILTHSMSAPLFEVASHSNKTLDIWNKNYARAVHIAPAHTLFFADIDELDKTLHKFAKQSQLPLTDLFTKENAARDKLPVQWLLHTLKLQQEALELLSNNKQSTVPTLNIFDKNDLLIAHNQTFPKRNMRWTLQLQEAQETPHTLFSKKVWNIARAFFINQTIPKDATDDPNHKFPAPPNQNLAGNLLRSHLPSSK